MQVTGHGEKLRWYHVLPDFTYNKLRFLTKAVRSVYFKTFMSKCSTYVYMLIRMVPLNSNLTLAHVQSTSALHVSSKSPE